MEWISLFRNQTEGDQFYKTVQTTVLAIGADEIPANGILGNSTTRIVALLPEDIAAGGDVTLLRIVGDLLISYAEASLSDFQGELAGLCTATVQLAQVTGTAGLQEHVYQVPTSSLSQEKSNILWQLSFDFTGPLRDPGTTTVVINPGGDTEVVLKHAYPIDIPVKRRWDRSQYQLVYTMTFDTAFMNAFIAASNAGIYLNLRGLFLTQGGI